MQTREQSKEEEECRVPSSVCGKKKKSEDMTHASLCETALVTGVVTGVATGV